MPGRARLWAVLWTGLRSRACLTASIMEAPQHVPSAPTLPQWKPCWTLQGSWGQGSLHSRWNLGTCAARGRGGSGLHCGVSPTVSTGVADMLWYRWQQEQSGSCGAGLIPAVFCDLSILVGNQVAWCHTAGHVPEEHCSCLKCQNCRKKQVPAQPHDSQLAPVATGPDP